jgi:hypothetical protein
MLLTVNSWWFSRAFLPAIFILLGQASLFSQTMILKGTVKDEKTKAPVGNVNIRIFGTTGGVSTDNSGQFSLELAKVPVSLVISCVGYEVEYFGITSAPGTPVEFFLTPKSYTLQEVDISAQKYSFIFKDRNYSVLDYELWGDDILLLVYRYGLSRAELVLLNKTGDTLAVSGLPETPPVMLFRDFLHNVHYFSKTGNAYQCFYSAEQESLSFPCKTTVDSLQANVGRFIFRMGDRLYFQESTANGYGSAIGYYSKGSGKKYISRIINMNKMTEYADDVIFEVKWNKFLAGIDNLAYGNFAGGEGFNEFDQRAHDLFYFSMDFPVIKTGEDEIAVFNFENDDIEIMDGEGVIKKTVPIAFHREFLLKADTAKSVHFSTAGWRWESPVLSDDSTHQVYLKFRRNGLVKIRRIDIETGELKAETILPFPFPEKIEIFNGEAYFLVRSDGLSDTWKLAKCRL